jgi:Flp pilus assembly protein TadD
MLDRDLFGPEPSGFHFTNLILHAFNGGLLFWLLRRLTGAPWRSAGVAAMFAWHPAHVESVAWVAERKDVLSTFFGFLSLLFYTQYAQARDSFNEVRPGTQERTMIPASFCSFSYQCAWLCFALGLLGKAMLVTWPFVMLLLDFWPLGRWRSLRPGRLFREKIPFFCLAAAVSAVTLVDQHHSGAVVPLKSLPLSVRCDNASISYCRYLGKLFWPTDLAIFYPHLTHVPPPPVLVLAASFLACVTLLFLLLRQAYPFLLMGWLWFGGTLVPVIGLVQVGDQGLADRYTYIPSVGIFIVMIWGMHALTKTLSRQAILLSSFGVSLLLLSLGLTRHQLGYWRNSETLFRHTIAVTKDNYLILNNLGAALSGAGQADAAMEPLQEALRLRPHDAMVHYNIGIVRFAQGDKNDAVSQFKEALRLKPDYWDAHYNLGLTLASMDRLDEAITQFREAIQLRPDFTNARNNLGAALASAGHYEEAIQQFREVLRLEPDYATVQINLEQALELQRQNGGSP